MFVQSRSTKLGTTVRLAEPAVVMVLVVHESYQLWGGTTEAVTVGHTHKMGRAIID